MKIALLGYGKMGKTIEKIALSKGHEIVLRADSADFDLDSLKKADVAIEFSTPASVIDNIYKCFDCNVPVVVGTTGWYGEFNKIKADCENRQQALFYATNFSIGVNIFFKINQLLASLMNSQTDYKVSMEEIHHTQKLDSPSGTAITTAEQIIEKIDRLNGWEEVEGNNMPSDSLKLGILAEREEDVKGTHIVKYTSPIDTIEIKHEAHTRDGFAMGAVLAAEWITNKQGVYNMNDLMKELI